MILKVEEGPRVVRGSMSLRNERATPVMTQSTQLSPRAAVVLGCLVAAMGGLVILLALGMIGPTESSIDRTPPWVVVCAGLAFVLCGAALIVGFAVAGGAGPDGDLPAGTPWGVRLTQYLLGLGISGLLAAIATWVAFGPGPRTFSATVPFVGRGPAKEWLGRGVFGVGAVLMYLFIAVMAVISARRLRGRK
jgi:hypothetical protein